MATLPNFDSMKNNYPQGTSEEVKARIGGAVNADWVTNTCAIRLSRSMNYSGTAIPSGQQGLKTINGADKKHYAFRVAEMKKWLQGKYGTPSLTLKGPSTSAPAALKGKKGVICFLDCGWSDATGHLDLWDGEKCVGHEYFNVAKQVLLWEAKPASGQPTKVVTVKVLTKVRSTPSPRGTEVGTLKPGTQVQVFARQTGFIKVDRTKALWIWANDTVG